MKIGCFALIQPFSPMRRQFELIRELGFDFADLTDNHDGATLGTEYGFSASFSLDSHPATILDMVSEFNLTLTSVCAHANLLDPTSPDRYATADALVTALDQVRLAMFASSGSLPAMTAQVDRPPPAPPSKALTPPVSRSLPPVSISAI